jgi:hypothetical protein
MMGSMVGNDGNYFIFIINLARVGDFQSYGSRLLLYQCLRQENLPKERSLIDLSQFYWSLVNS